jgi:hypothetical protein
MATMRYRPRTVSTEYKPMSIACTIAGILLICSGIGIIAVPWISGDNRIDEQIDAFQKRSISSQHQTIVSMDKTILAQWQTIAILSRRLGEDPPRMPVSVTGLPDQN